MTIRKIVTLLTAGGKTATWMQTHKTQSQGALSCEGCGVCREDIAEIRAHEHAASCRVISVIWGEW